MPLSGDGERYAIYHAEAQAQGKRGEECAGATAGAELSFTPGPEVKRVIALKALDRFKQRIREITRRAKSVSMETTIEELAPYMRCLRSYFGFCETPEVLIGLTPGLTPLGPAASQGGD